MWVPLIISTLLQSAAPATGLACRSDPETGGVQVIITQSRQGTLGAFDRSGGWAPAHLDGRPEAAGLDWYESGEPIIRDGRRYHPEPGTWSPGSAVNRYLRHVGLHEGAPLFSIWPGGDHDLAVLVRQEDCLFRVYERGTTVGD